MFANTIYLLDKVKKVNIGFFGGSITEGAGAGDGKHTSWRGAVTDWFRATYPEVEINVIQGAIGGTGSELGIFRIEHDLLSKKPDLVFLEFSVNDSDCSYEETLINAETLVRRIYKDNPMADILYVHTTTKVISHRLQTGNEYVSRAAHSAVAHHYGVKQLDVGEILRHEVAKKGEDWLAYTIDNVHPNDAGYKVYTQAVINLLKDELVGKSDKCSPVMLPHYLTNPGREKAGLIDTWKVGGHTWKKVNASLCDRYEHYIEGKPGDTLTYTFEGSGIGLYYMLAHDAGDVAYCIDGGEERKLRMWDAYCKSFDRAGGVLLSKELPYGIHRLTLRCLDKKADESEGYTVRIGAFLQY